MVLMSGIEPARPFTSGTVMVCECRLHRKDKEKRGVFYSALFFNSRRFSALRNPPTIVEAS